MRVRAELSPLTLKLNENSTDKTGLSFMMALNYCKLEITVNIKKEFSEVPVELYQMS